MDVGRYSLLLVDDAPEATQLLRRVLCSLGFLRIDESGSGVDALRRMHDLPYDMVISDWNMQPMNGLTLLHEIRADGRLAATRFVMITGSGDTDHVQTARAEGADGFILKPYSIEAVRKQIRSILGQPDVRKA